jgi:signal transduction histidine kinase
MSVLEEKGVKLNVTVPPEPLTVKGDPHRLKQIIVNLLSNAVKFTHHGTVDIILRVIENVSPRTARATRKQQLKSQQLAGNVPIQNLPSSPQPQSQPQLQPLQLPLQPAQQSPVRVNSPGQLRRTSSGSQVQINNGNGLGSSGSSGNISNSNNELILQVR